MNTTTLSDGLRLVTDAILHVRTAQGLIGLPEYAPLLDALTESKKDIERRVAAQRAALAGDWPLRPTFRVAGKHSSSMACVVFRPKDGECCRYITEASYRSLLRLLCTDGPLEVCAKYDVLVKSDYNETVEVIRHAE